MTSLREVPNLQVSLPLDYSTGPRSSDAPCSRLATTMSREDGAENTAALDGVRILLVEDTKDMRDLITRMLAKAGAEVAAAESAKEAREYLIANIPDVIVSDIAMPEEDGLTFLNELRREESASGHHIPAIALTAFVGKEYRYLTLRAGFEEHLCKPVTKATLIATILAVLRSVTESDPH